MSAFTRVSERSRFKLPPIQQGKASKCSMSSCSKQKSNMVTPMTSRTCNNSPAPADMQSRQERIDSFNKIHAEAVESMIDLQNRILYMRLTGTFIPSPKKKIRMWLLLINSAII